MQKAIELTVGNNTLRGMLNTPDSGKGGFPLLVIYHGFTGTKVEEHFLYTKLGRHLEARGIGSLRYDFSGSGESDGEFRDMTLSGEIVEASAIHKSALALAGVDSEAVFLYGHSMGALVASVVAAEATRKPKGLVLVAPAGNMADIVSGKLAANVSRVDPNGDTDMGGLLLGKGFLPDLLALDPWGRAEGYAGGVCVVHGTADTVVPECFGREYFERYPGKKRYVPIEGAGHTFDSIAFEERLFAEVSSFIADSIR